MPNDYRNKIFKNMIYTFQVYLPFLIGAWIFLSIREPQKYFLHSFSMFIAGFSGVIMIIRKESPTSRKIIRGKWAVFSGVIFTILLWGFSLYYLFLGLR